LKFQDAKLQLELQFEFFLSQLLDQLLLPLGLTLPKEHLQEEVGPSQPPKQLCMK